MDKSALLAKRIRTDEVPIPGVGTVRVRGLSRAQMYEAGKRDAEGAQVREILLLHYGMADPELSEEEAAEWQANSDAMEIQAVIEKINELSKFSREAQQEAYKSLRGAPGD